MVPGDEGTVFDHLSEAIAFAEQQARLLAHARALENGANNISVTVNMEEVAAALAEGGGKSLLMEVRVNALAIGEPCL